MIGRTRMYEVDVLVEGYPGKAVCHGGLGWSTIALLRGQGRVALVDCGGFGLRAPLKKQLDAKGIKPDEVTDILLTHLHHDHAINWILFPKARVWAGRRELQWAGSGPCGFNPVPELYVRELARSPQLRMIESGMEVLPGITCTDAAGHTPGHVVFLVDAGDKMVIFTGDAAKNRAELISRNVDATLDLAASVASIDAILALWRSIPGALVVPGHDLTMCLDAAGAPVYLGERKAAIAAWFGETVEQTTVIDLCSGSPGPFKTD